MTVEAAAAADVVVAPGSAGVGVAGEVLDIVERGGEGERLRSAWSKAYGRDLERLWEGPEVAPRRRQLAALDLEFPTSPQP